jgi:predicted component of type VI protein secretion system
VQREGSFWERGRVLELPPNISEGTLGRSFSCTWRLNHPKVSRIHAALVRRARRGVYVVDLASETGTFVNDERVSGEMLLMDGDRIRLGDTVMLEFMDSPPSPVESPERTLLRRLIWAAGGLGVVVLMTAFLF